jgi:hypothetical protein
VERFDRPRAGQGGRERGVTAATWNSAPVSALFGRSRLATSHMRELRIQVEGHPYRVLYAFNPLRNAILLLGGDKTGDGRWYEVSVPVADRLDDEHLIELNKKGLL